MRPISATSELTTNYLDKRFKMCAAFVWCQSNRSLISHFRLNDMPVNGDPFWISNSNVLLSSASHSAFLFTPIRMYKHSLGVCVFFFLSCVCVFLVFLLKPKHRSHITDAREFLEFRLCVFFSCCCSDYFRFHFGAIVRGFVLSVVHLFTRIQNTNNKKKTMRKIEKKSTNSSIYASNNERRE